MAKAPKKEKTIKTPKGRSVKVKAAATSSPEHMAAVSILADKRLDRVKSYLHQLLKGSHTNLQAAEDYLRTSATHLHDNGVHHPAPDELADRIYLVKDDLKSLMNDFAPDGEKS